MHCLRMIGDYISFDMAYMIESACCHQQPPERVAERILEEMIANDVENIMEDIHNKLQDIRNPHQAISNLLREMDYETSVDIDQTMDLGGPPWLPRWRIPRCSTTMKTAVSGPLYFPNGLYYLGDGP
ncbi:hypothetical protein AB205_0194380 [Aquarana catesbeiana]|uniref:NUP160 helical domain-containing protein n=1 Tax=Aquarana catesbeiana TaxID=8400 RepID=A0A2G9S691_AQUCT|nr:hypothetical protein AB205_0194380 [Aquarana catesbeiana]